MRVCGLSAHFAQFFLLIYCEENFNIYSNKWVKKWATGQTSDLEVIFQVKTTWQDVFNSFKAKYPNLSAKAVNYRPYDFMAIEVFLRDGQKVIYSGVQGRAKIAA